MHEGGVNLTVERNGSVMPIKKVWSQVIWLARPFGDPGRGLI